MKCSTDNKNMSEDSCYESESTESKSSIWSDQRLHCTGAKPKKKGKYTDLKIDCQINASKACEKLQKKFDVLGWPGYKDKELVIVMFSTKSIPGFPDDFETFRVILITDKENTMSMREAPRLLANDVKYCRPIIQKYGEELMENHSNISMIIPTAYRIKQGKILAHVCIAIYCRGKGVIPLQESLFPTTLDGVDIDVREGYCTFGMRNAELLNSHDYHENLRIGVEIGWPGGPQGTLGGFIKLQTGQILILTCAHVVIPYPCLISSENYRYSTHSTCSTCNNINVWQPPHISYRPAMGRVYDAVFNCNQPDSSSVDAAFVVITDKHRIPTDPFMTKQPSTTPQLRKAGFTENNPPHFSSGEIMPQMDEPLIGHMVVKCGAVTKLTHGVLALDGSIFRMENQEMRMPGIEAQHNPRIVMYRQYLVESLGKYPFFQMGDSGSLVFMHHGRDLKCIGMAIGNTSHGGCIVTPIEAILEAFHNDHHFDDPPFFPFDDIDDDDEDDDDDDNYDDYDDDDDCGDDDDGDGDDDNDGDDESDGFNHDRNRRQKQNRDNQRSNKYRALDMDHFALDTRKDHEGPQQKRPRYKRWSVNSQFADGCSSAKYENEDRYKKVTSKAQSNRRQQPGDPVYKKSIFDSGMTSKGLYRAHRSQTASSNDIPNNSGGNTGCENDFDKFLSEEIIDGTSVHDIISNINKTVLVTKEQNENIIKAITDVLTNAAGMQSKVKYSTKSIMLDVVGKDHVVVSPDVAVLTVDGLQNIISQIHTSIKRNEEDKQNALLSKIKQTLSFDILKEMSLSFLAILLYNSLKLSFGSDQGTLFTNIAEALKTFTKTEMDT